MGCIRHALSKKERKKVLKEFAEKFPKLKIESKVQMEIGVCDGKTLYFINSEPVFLKDERGMLIPLLRYIYKAGNMLGLPLVIVDMGAVKHILNGADVMAPGIVKIIGDFNKGDVVLVVDEKYSKPLAVCEALYSSKEISSMRRGKVLKNLHYVGDRIWRLKF